MNEQVTPTPEAPAAPAAPIEHTKEELMEQLKYAQKLINLLQEKLNNQQGINIQLEAKLQIATEKEAPANGE